MTRAGPTPGKRRPLGDGRRPEAGFSLRRVGVDDVDVILRLRTRLLRESGGHSAAALRRHRSAFGPWFERELRARRLWGWLAEDPNGRPVGSGLLWLQPRQPSPRFPQTRTPYILSMYTMPQARRRGVARAIVDRLVASARRCGYTRVELHATAAGVHVYTKLGFRPTDQMRLELTSPRRPERRLSRGGAPR